MPRKSAICTQICASVPANIAAEIDQILGFVASAKSVADLNLAFQKFASRYGSLMTCQLTINKAPTTPSGFSLVGFNAERYTNEYMENGFSNIDYCARTAFRSILPLLWGMSEHRKNYNDDDKRLYGFAEDYGVRHGMIIPIHTSSFSSVLAFADDGSEEDFRKRVSGLVPIASMFGIFAADAIQRLNLVPDLPALPSLTPRELECLRWAAAGKTAWEISMILGISERTALAHSENAKSKLNAKTLPQAVALALSLGLITL